MIDIGNTFHNVRNEVARTGYARTLKRRLYHMTNRLLSVRRLEIIYLTRDHLLPLDPTRYIQHSSRFATLDELQAMRAEGKWNLSEELLDGFRQDDRCLLSFVDGKLAGYTWVHVAGRPCLVPGVRISIPGDYLYNFAGFTLPEFRGCGLQPYRHHEILGRPEWSGKKGLIGYVDTMNWSSKKGQSKSGYQRVGTLTLIGGRSSFTVLFSNELDALGIRRLEG